jgi:hypothetical protein
MKPWCGWFKILMDLLKANKNLANQMNDIQLIMYGPTIY